MDSSEEAVKMFLHNLTTNFKNNFENFEDIVVRDDNFPSNGDCESAMVCAVKADVNHFLKRIINNITDRNIEKKRNELFDVVICDPPKLAPGKAHLKKAIARYVSVVLTLSPFISLVIIRYVKINAAAMQVVRPGGLLLTCSCSTMVAQNVNSFPEIIREAARKAGKSVVILSTSSAGLDHPLHAGYMDGKHLTVMLARVI